MSHITFNPATSSFGLKQAIARKKIRQIELVYDGATDVEALRSIDALITAMPTLCRDPEFTKFARFDETGVDARRLRYVANWASSFDNLLLSVAAKMVEKGYLTTPECEDIQKGEGASTGYQANKNSIRKPTR